jgi:hypothetical protein
MPCVGFEPPIPASERAKTVHALDRSATVTDSRGCLHVTIYSPSDYVICCEGISQLTNH